MLETARLLLRSPGEHDQTVISASGSDPAAQRWLGWAPDTVMDEKDRERILARRPGQGPLTRPAGWLSLLAIDKESGLAAGYALVHPAEPVQGGAHLAPRFRGRGYGTELFTAATEFAHQHLGFPAVVAGTAADNLASRRALRAAGYTQASGPATHVLPDGRVVGVTWARHESAEPALCPAGKATLRWARQAAAAPRSEDRGGLSVPPY